MSCDVGERLRDSQRWPGVHRFAWWLDNLVHHLHLQRLTGYVLCDLHDAWLLDARLRDVRRERRHPAPPGYWYGWDTSQRPAVLRLTLDSVRDSTLTRREFVQ